MAQHWEVLQYLRPQGGYVQVGEEYEGIEFIECEPFTKAEYEAAFELVEIAKAQEKTERQVQKQAILDRLGLTEEELRIVLG